VLPQKKARSHSRSPSTIRPSPGIPRKISRSYLAKSDIENTTRTWRAPPPAAGRPQL
jgi:hypothetical protein